MADFGLSKQIHSSNYYRQNSVVCVPIKWMAMESLSESIYTTKSDVVSRVPPLGTVILPGDVIMLPADVLPSVSSVVVWGDHVGDSVPGEDPLPGDPELRAAGPATVWSTTQSPLRL